MAVGAIMLARVAHTNGRPWIHSLFFPFRVRRRFAATHR